MEQTLDARINPEPADDLWRLAGSVGHVLAEQAVLESGQRAGTYLLWRLCSDQGKDLLNRKGLAVFSKPSPPNIDLIVILSSHFSISSKIEFRSLCRRSGFNIGSHPVLVPGGNQFAVQYGIFSIPTMWLVDKRGNLRDINVRVNLERRVTSLLDEPSPAPK